MGLLNPKVQIILYKVIFVSINFINREVQAYAGAGQSTKAPDVYGSSLRNMYFEPADQAMSAIERLRQGLP